MTTVVFLHGLNTFGTDDMRIGLINFGLMHTPLEKEFRKRDVEFVAVTGIGCGTPEEQARIAVKFLADHGHLEGHKLILFGHSVGGLVARALSAQPEMKDRVKMIITAGTPHFGAHVADLGMSFDTRHPLLYRMMKWTGYDTKTKTQIMERFTLKSIAAFNASNVVPKSIREISLLCEATPAELSLPYLIGYPHLHERDSSGVYQKSDGFILSESQKRGEVIGPFAIDHYGEMGFFFQVLPSARRQAKAEFSRLVDTIAKFANE